MMLKHGFAKMNFKGFMADNTHANWNVVKIVYGFGDPFIKMVDKECTYLFHWTQLLDRHTKQLIKLDLQDQHNVLCHEYKNEKSLMEANSCYVIICWWWFSLGATFEACVHELANWLNFWHFGVKRWEDFMVHVDILPSKFLSFFIFY
jgi:hypothetical protein